MMVHDSLSSRSRGPGGRQIDSTYGTSGSISDLLSGVDEIEESSTTYVSYQYNGLGRMVEADYEQPETRLQYTDGDVDDDYEGLDRFGRVIDQQWYDYDADVDRFLYDHDRVGNPTYRDIPSGLYASNDKDQAYTYDDLHRLKTFDTGTLSGSTITGTPDSEQDFALDQLGNWSTWLVKASGSTTLDQDRTSNDVNEITNITEGGSQAAWVTPAYDDNGNMTQGPAPGSETTNNKYIYDAWNRLVEVTDNSDVTIARYEYDGLNRRIVKTDELADPDVDYDYFYNEQWQIVEVRKDDDTDPLKQMIWHPYYVDALAMSYDDPTTAGSTIFELYHTHDANFNQTCEILYYNGAAAAAERYEYDSYGQVTVLDQDFSDDADNKSDIGNFILFAGYRLDTESGLYEVRNRFYHPSLGRWMQRDPIGYVDGMSVYEYVSSSPNTFVDPVGTWRWRTGKRVGNPRTTMIAEKGDSVQSAAQFARMQAEESLLWLMDQTTGQMVAPDELIKPDCPYTVPNTIYAQRGDASSLISKGDWYGFVPRALRFATEHYAMTKESHGFHVIVDLNATEADVRAALSDPNAYGWFYAAHGVSNDKGSMISSDDKILDPILLHDALHHRLGEVTLFSCWAADKAHPTGPSDRGWLNYISDHGWLRATCSRIHVAWKDWWDLPTVHRQPDDNP